MKYLFFLLVLVLFPAYGAFRFTGDAGFEIDGVKGELYLYDGKAKKELKLTGKPSGDTVILQGDQCRLEVKAESRARLYHFIGTAVNESRKECFWEIGVRLFPELQKGDLFWGGVDVLPIKDKPIIRAGKGAGSFKRDHRPWLAFPTSAVFGGKRAVIAAGRNGAPISYSAAALYPRGKSSALTYSIRLVPGPGRSLKFNLAAGTVPLRFENEENIVQAHYDAFPEDWSPRFDWNHPYIWGAHSYYSAWKPAAPQRELQRRRYAYIEWAYTPWKRPGDIYGHEKYWHYKPNLPFVRAFSTIYNGEYFDYSKMTVPEFHRRRKKLFDRFGTDFGYCFYSCPAWCEYNLAKEYFPDSLKLDLDPSLPRELGRWTTLNHRELAVMPMWSDYGKFYTDNLRRIYQELKPAGFALDGGGCGVYYRGEATKDPSIPERAWDDKGVFMDESAAVDRLVDFIHDLNPENPPVAWKNGLGKSDFMMLETSIFNPFFRQWMPHMRYMMGQRPVSVHSPGYLFDETIPFWRNMTHSQFMHAFSKLADHVVFTDFEYGFTQCFSTRDGNPRSIYVQPELLECITLGWQALTPVETDNRGKYLYRSRFGRGADTIFFFGNPWEKPMPLQFKVDNSALGGVTFFVRKMRDHSALTQRYHAPDTVFKDTLPSRLPVLYEAIIGLSSAPDGIGAVVTVRKDLNRIVCSVKLDNAKPFAAKVSARRIRNFIPEIKVNGKKTPGAIPAGAEIQVEYRSRFFETTYAQLAGFPWLKSRIVLPADANDAERQAAAKIREYFAFLKLKMNGGDGIIRIAVRKNTENKIRLNGRELFFHAADPAAARRLMRELNYAMDRKFFWFVKEPYGGPVMKKRFDFIHHPLSYRKCFEQEAK